MDWLRRDTSDDSRLLFRHRLLLPKETEKEYRTKQSRALWKACRKISRDGADDREKTNRGSDGLFVFHGFSPSSALTPFSVPERLHRMSTALPAWRFVSFSEAEVEPVPPGKMHYWQCKPGMV